LASDGSHGPKPYTQRQSRTLFLRVPHADWVAITRGVKREFRASPRSVSKLWDSEPPTPVVSYRFHPAHGYDAKLMVLEDIWIEPLGAITPESLEAEGFETFAEFRRYFCLREKTRFRPTRKITVYKVRPWEDADERRFADRLFERLYGAFTDAT
jgi:hypothetical protein